MKSFHVETKEAQSQFILIDNDQVEQIMLRESA